MLTNLITALGTGDVLWHARQRNVLQRAPNSAEASRKIDLFQRKIDFLPISCVTARPTPKVVFNSGKPFQKESAARSERERGKNI